MIRFYRQGCGGPIEYAIKFTHNSSDDGKRRETIAQIVRPKGQYLLDDVEIAKGVSVCSAPCNYNYNTGRKMALKRALEKSLWGRDIRREVWKRYFEARGKVN